MCHSLYVKANGEMPCWDDIGETLTLRTLDEGALRDNRELPIFHGTELQEIRKSFIAGRDPHPGLCNLCGVHEQGGTEVTLNPRTMEVLNLEASYLCHLSCPQCIPARDRRLLKAPPYNMTRGLLDGLLLQLRREGVENIRFIHFEGRGDPLVNSRLPELIELSRHHFPQSLIGVTSHCSYPYMPWLVQSGLDVLRASIDGATPESYLKYRVGGNFERTVEFLSRLRDDRIKTHSPLRVEWKYILFEWNDSHSEMLRAAELAKELQVHLTFVRTHTPGRSLRFQTDQQLSEYIRRFAPGSAIEPTFQLRSANKATAPNAVIAEHVSSLLSLATERLRAGDRVDAGKRVAEALKRDPGIAIPETEDLAGTVRQFLPNILANAQFPSTLTWLAAVCREIGQDAASDELLMKYLEVAPDAPDRKHVLLGHFIRSAEHHAADNHFDLAHSDLRQAIWIELDIAPEPGEAGNPVLCYLDRVLKANCSPWLVSGMAHVAFAEKNFPAARALFQRYVEIVPDTADATWAAQTVAAIDAHIQKAPVRSRLSRRALHFLRHVF